VAHDNLLSSNGIVATDQVCFIGQRSGHVCSWNAMTGSCCRKEEEKNKGAVGIGLCYEDGVLRNKKNNE